MVNTREEDCGLQGDGFSSHGAHLSLKLIQVLAPVQMCDLLVSCKEDILGILWYMMIWKSEWATSKDLLRKLGWSMVDAAMMNPSPMEYPLGQFVKMNILMWNCRRALNPNFTRRIFEMAINHQSSIMVITETRVGGDRAVRIIEGLPFDGFITTNTIGYAGGLWVLWKKEDAEVILLDSTEQEIHATVKVCSSNLTWLISTIYASPRLVERKMLWSNLSEVANLHTLPWLLLGDFNEVLCGEEKFRGRQVNLNRALEFKDCIDACNVIDLGFAGPKFTWTNKRPISDLILERIDRCFASLEWRLLFPEATVTHLPRTFFDHHPVLVELCKPKTDHGSKPFRFQTMWLLHPDFHKVVHETWCVGASLIEAISRFTNSARKWNAEVFARKRRVLARLNRTQKALANNLNNFLLQLERELIEEYSLILLREEEFWALKFRLNVATFGDKNTAFFHVSTVVCRHRNKIRCIRNGEGEWFYEEDKVKDHIQRGFIKLYTTKMEASHLIALTLGNSCFSFSNEERELIGKDVSDEEIRRGLWVLKPFKALGSDGLHARFFQHFWHGVKDSTYTEVKNIFAQGFILGYLDETLITLIPKCKNPETISHYRPISLCNSIYEVVSKILFGRIRPLLNNIILPVQSAFIPGRRGLDNVLIAQELIYAMDRKKGKAGCMAIKIDLEKAYDRLEWSFVYKILHAFHFPQNIIKLIMSCVSSTSISILVNGGKLDSFAPSCGIRQGDPLSSYLCILCMEYLSYLIEEKCVDGSWPTIKASRRNVGISHLIFADDLTLFSEANDEACEAISDVL